MVDWSVKAGNGIFAVKLWFGDPTANSKIDLSINGKAVFNGIVKKGEQKIIEQKVEAKGEFIKITSPCEKDCNYAMAKISAVQISPITNEPKPKMAQSKVNEEEKCGYGFVKGKYYFFIF